MIASSSGWNGRRVFMTPSTCSCRGTPVQWKRPAYFSCMIFQARRTRALPVLGSKSVGTFTVAHSPRDTFMEEVYASSLLQPERHGAVIHEFYVHVRPEFPCLNPRDPQKHQLINKMTIERFCCRGRSCSNILRPITVFDTPRKCKLRNHENFAPDVTKCLIIDFSILSIKKAQMDYFLCKPPCLR